MVQLLNPDERTLCLLMPMLLPPSGFLWFNVSNDRLGQGFWGWFCPHCASAAALGSLPGLQHLGKEPEQCCSRCRARGFSGALIAYGCTMVYITFREKGAFKPGCCPDRSASDGAGAMPSPAELRLLLRSEPGPSGRRYLAAAPRLAAAAKKLN